MKPTNGPEALEIARKLYPNANNLQLIEHGYDNIVILVEEDYTLKFPRNESAVLSNLFESKVLPYFNHITNVQIPVFIRHNTDPVFTIYKQVLGKPLNKADIDYLSLDESMALGKDIASLLYAVHKSMPVNDLVAMKHELNHDPEFLDWPNYLKNSLYLCTSLNPIQNTIANKYYEKWLKLDKTTHKIVIHDDMHPNNILFINGRLSGVIDFGDMTVGTAEQELRILWQFGDQVLDATISEYEKLANRKLDVEAIHIWAISQELAKYATYSAKTDTNNHSFMRAQRLLNRWLPEGKW